MRVGLIVVDVQHDFCDPQGSLYVQGAEAIGSDLEALRGVLYSQWQRQDVREFFTMDSHPPDHVSFAKNHKGAAEFTEVTLGDGTQQMLWPVHCVKETPGWEVYKGVGEQDRSSVVFVNKGTKTNVDSYSGFGSQDGTSEVTELLARLRQERVTHVVVCGVAFDYCVSYTAKDAAKHGFATCVVRSATRGVAGDSMALEEGLMREAGVVIVDDPAQVIGFTSQPPPGPCVSKPHPPAPSLVSLL